MTEFGRRLRELRQNKKMSQEELAFKAGISPAHLGQIERAEKNPTLETIGKLSEALGISLPELFSFEITADSMDADKGNAIIDKINAQLKGMTAEGQKDILRVVKIFNHYIAKN